MIPTLLAVLAALQLPPLSGEIPRALDGVSRIIFVASDESSVDAGCSIQASRWTCAHVPAGAHGVVVLVGIDSVGWTTVGPADHAVSIANWGRIIQIAPGGVAPEDLHDIELTAWKPDRPRARPQSRHFMAVADDDVHVERLSGTRFWVVGRVADPDAFLALDGPAIGSLRLATARLAEEPVDQVVYLNAAVGVTLHGQVQGSRGEGATDADVELLELLEMSAQPKLVDEAVVIQRRTTTVAADGTFRFDRVTGGPFRIDAWHPQLGRAQAWAMEASATVALKLRPPPRVTGRVLERGLPVAGARIRYVPDATAWAAAANPIDYITAESTSADEGRFAVAVPALRAGTIQIVAPDGGVARVAVPEVRSGELSVGDVAIPDRSSLFVRLTGGAGCDLLAVGPLGALGLVMVRATSPADLYQLDLPEAGSWALSAECRGELIPVDPPVVTVPAGSNAPIDRRVAKPRTDGRRRVPDRFPGDVRDGDSSSPWCKSIVAPRAAMRPAGKARRPRISGIFEGGATPPDPGVPAARFSARWGGDGMQRRSNADGVAPRAAKVRSQTSGLLTLARNATQMLDEVERSMDRRGGHDKHTRGRGDERPSGQRHQLTEHEHSVFPHA